MINDLHELRLKLLAEWGFLPQIEVIKDKRVGKIIQIRTNDEVSREMLKDFATKIENYTKLTLHGTLNETFWALTIYRIQVWGETNG